MLYNRQRRVARDLALKLSKDLNQGALNGLCKVAQEEEKKLIALESNRKLVRTLEKSLLIIAFPFFCIWVIVLMPIAALLWLISRYDRERETL